MEDDCFFEGLMLAIFHLDWPAKKDPHKSGSTCLKCRVLKGKAGLVGVFFFAGQSKWKIGI